MNQNEVVRAVNYSTGKVMQLTRFTLSKPYIQRQGWVEETIDKEKVEPQIIRAAKPVVSENHEPEVIKPVKEEAPTDVELMREAVKTIESQTSLEAKVPEPKVPTKRGRKPKAK